MSSPPFTAVGLVPAPLLLLPRYGDQVDIAADLRAAAVAALRAVTGSTQEVVVVHAADREPRHSMPAAGRRVAEHLLDLAGWAGGVRTVEVPWDASAEDCRATGAALATGGSPRALVVVGDGCARRTLKAPGHLDERSFDVDDATAAALQPVLDPDALLALDPLLADELLFQGRAPLQVLAAVVLAGGTPYETVSYDASDPYGVRYYTAVWRPMQPDAALGA